MARMSEAVAEKAVRVHERMNHRINAIRANSDLSADGQRRQIAAEYVKAKAELGTIQSTFEQGAEANARVLTRDIFGASSVAAGADAISLRDAAARVSQIGDPQEALTLLNSAELTGDHVLARAVAQKAYEGRRDPIMGHDWDGVLGAYVENRPEVAGKLQALESASGGYVEENFRNAGLFYLVAPSELNGVNAEALAAQGEMA